MTKTALSLAWALFLVACGGALATSSVAQTQLAPADAFQCVMKEFEKLGYQRTMYDTDELRTDAKKVNPNISFSSTLFRKTWDRLAVQVKPGTAGTDLSVVATTVAEYFTQNGQNFNPLQPSPDVQEAARAVQQRCDGSGPRPDTVSQAQ